jgi:hypothetical protein
MAHHAIYAWFVVGVLIDHVGKTCLLEISEMMVKLSNNNVKG